MVYAVVREPAMSKTAPAAHKTPPTAGESFWSLRVVTPTEALPILAEWVSLLGIGTTNDRMPRTRTTSPTIAKGRIVFLKAED
jgi:hypothetical protein